MLQGKWKALKGGLVWYPGTITSVNKDDSVDVLYDDGDSEYKVPLRFIQLLDKQPSGSPGPSNRRGKRKGANTAAEGTKACKRRLSPALQATDVPGKMSGERNSEVGDPDAMTEMQNAGNDDDATNDCALPAGGTKGSNAKGKGRGKARSNSARAGTGAARQSKSRLRPTVG